MFQILTRAKKSGFGRLNREKMTKKNILTVVCISIVSFTLNFIVFVMTYNRLATPFITEEQRVLNADFIMSVTVGAFAIVAVLTGFAMCMILRKL